MPRPVTLKPKRPIHTLHRVRWHQWSVVRLAWIAMATVLAGYLTAAVLAVKSIDHLLRVVHDTTVEQSLKTGLENIKDVYKIRQELLVERLNSVIAKPGSISSDKLKATLSQAGAETIMKEVAIGIIPDQHPGEHSIKWLSRQDLGVGPHIVRFADGTITEKYRSAEEILQRYQFIGFELRDRIRPALIKALSITLAVMCLLLMIAFVYMAVRGKTRIQKLVQGFIHYAERDDSFRFTHHPHNELGLLSKQFNNMADELDDNRSRAIGLEKLASWQTIARKMAHEIKNPLTPIQIMIAQLNRHYDGADKEYAELLAKAHNVIIEEVQSLRRMVDDFSEFAQLPSPRFALCNVVLCAKQTIALAEGSYLPHTITLESTSENITAEIDEQLIRQALHNLIKNAAEADPESPAPINLLVRHDNENIIFEIEDHGPGIPDNLKESVFEAYVTTKHTGPTPGMGLGLAICQKIVLEHAGKIAIESIPGRTIFRITIPRHRKGVRL